MIGKEMGIGTGIVIGRRIGIMGIGIVIVIEGTVIGIMGIMRRGTILIEIMGIVIEIIAIGIILRGRRGLTGRIEVIDIVEIIRRGLDLIRIMIKRDMSLGHMILLPIMIVEREIDLNLP
jgi:hypothetical protein